MLPVFQKSQEAGAGCGVPDNVDTDKTKQNLAQMFLITK